MEISTQEPIEGELYSGKEMFELERERLKSADKRTEIAKLAIEANDAADKRMFDYHMARIQKESELKRDQLSLIRWIAIGGGIIATTVVTLLFGMMFFGDAHQSELAWGILEKLGVALSGIGAYLLGKMAFGKLNAPPEE